MAKKKRKQKEHRRQVRAKRKAKKYNGAKTRKKS